MPKLTREKLYSLASAKAQLMAADALLRDASINAKIALGEGEVTDKVRTAIVAADEAMQLVFKRLEGEIS